VAELLQYEVVNPSDACTVEAECPVVAAVAVLMLGEGAYGLRDAQGEVVMPPLRFGGSPALTRWLADVGIASLGDYIEAKRETIAAVLDSAMYGGFADRAAYRKGFKFIDSEANRREWRQVWRRRWEDERRTSTTTICKAAWSLCEELRGAPAP